MKKVLIKIFLFLAITNPAHASYLRSAGKYIFTSEGEKIILKGMGLGGWLVREGYMLQTPGAGSPTDIENKITNLIGPDSAKVFFQRYEQHFLNRKDIDQLAEWGFNSVRLPFHYKALSSDLGSYNEEGFAIMDSLISWCADNQIYVILDMHVAPGSQSQDHNADSDGVARLWISKKNQDWAVEIWGEIAKRYKDTPWVGGYDLLNEPVHGDGKAVREIQRRMRDKIRLHDNKRILFVNGNWWSRAFEDSEPAFDDNMAWAFHYYSWMVFSKPTIQTINYLLELRNRSNRPLWLGEVGENSNEWFMEVRSLMETFDIGWAWWNHKKIGSIKGPLISMMDPVYREILDYWSGTAPKPSLEKSMLGLNNMLENLKIENCQVEKGVVASLLDDNYKIKNVPYDIYNIPGELSLVNYDIGAQGIAYFDYDIADYRNTGPDFKPWNLGWSYRNDGVDIETSTDQSISDYHISHTKDGEFLKYTFNVLKNDDYTFKLLSSSENTSGVVSIRMNNEILIENTELPITGDYNVWTETDLGTVNLSKGQNSITLLIARGGPNLKMLKIESEASLKGEGIYSHSISPNPTFGSLYIKFESLNSKNISLIIYNLKGQEIFKTSFDGKVGENQFVWDGRSQNGEFISSGIYLMSIGDGRRLIKEKFTIVR